MGEERPKFRISAYYNAWRDKSQPSHVTIDARMPTKAAAVELAAKFPKGAKIAGTSSNTKVGDEYVEQGSLGSHTVLEANDVNKGVNETGVKRYKTWMKHAPLHGDVEFTSDAANAYSSQEEFEQALLHPDQFVGVENEATQQMKAKHKPMRRE